MKVCIICQKEFTPGYKAYKQKTCGPECSKQNHRNLNSVYSKTKAKTRRENNSERFGLPQHTIEEYGDKFLEDNPEVVETLKLMWLMNGRSTDQLDNPMLETRSKNSYKIANKKYRSKKPDKMAICVVCNKEYNKSEEIRMGRNNNIETCSETCKENKLKEYHKNYNQTKRKK